MSYLMGELERQGIRVLASLESGGSSIVCTPSELFAWDSMNVQRMSLIGITKVSRANGVLEVSDTNGVQVRLSLAVSNEALSGFFAQVKSATQAAKAQATSVVPVTAPPIAAQPVPLSYPEASTAPQSLTRDATKTEVTATSLGRSPEKPIRMSDYADPLQAHLIRQTVPNTPAPRPKKFTDVRGKIYDELGFSFEYATVFDRFKAKFLDGIIIGIAQRGVEFLMQRPLKAKTEQLENLEKKVTGIMANPLSVPDDAESMIQDYVQLGINLAGDQLRLSLLAVIASLLLGWLYYALLESGPKYGTFGKQAARIGVVNYALERVSFGQATIRYFSSMLPAFIMLFLLLAFIAPLVAQSAQLFAGGEGTLFTKIKEGEALVSRMMGTFYTMTFIGVVTYIAVYSWAFFDKHRQTLYDLAAKTLVIKA
jgi:uncharacterized RDD family membrane protein YckC